MRSAKQKNNIFQLYRPFFEPMQQVGREVGAEVLGFDGTIIDTGYFHGHEESSIDEFARARMLAIIGRIMPNFHGTIRFELRPIAQQLLEAKGVPMFDLLIDEIEGTTNTKRALASPFEYPAQAGISMALLSSSSLRDILIGVFYDFTSDKVYAAIKAADGSFLSFCDGKLIDPRAVVETQGDSRKRVLVIGYSNTHRIKKGQVEQALCDAGYKVYEGVRSTGVDLKNVALNQFDAYIDLRKYWSTKNDDGEEQEAMLQTYDCAGMLPCVLGCGLKVLSPGPKKWTQYGLFDAIPIIVARPDVLDELNEIVEPMIEGWLPKPKRKRPVAKKAKSTTTKARKRK